MASGSEQLTLTPEPRLKRARSNSIRDDLTDAASRAMQLLSKDSPLPPNSPEKQTSNPLFGKRGMLERAISTQFSREVRPSFPLPGYSTCSPHLQDLARCREQVQEEETPENCFTRLHELCQLQELLDRRNSPVKPFNIAKSLSRFSPKKDSRRTPRNRQMPRRFSAVRSDSAESNDLAQQLTTAIEDAVASIYTLFDKKQSDLSRVEAMFEKTRDTLKQVMESVQDTVEDSTSSQALHSVLESIDNASHSGSPNEELLEGLRRERRAVIGNVIAFMQRNEQEEMLYLRSLLIQFLGALSNRQGLLCATITSTLLKKMDRILDNLSTVTALQQMVAEGSDEVPKSVFDDEEGNIWNYDTNDTTPKGGGTLNSLVMDLTSTDSYENNFTKSFIMTYRSFTSPWTLLKKLEQRYVDIPEDLPSFEKSQIQLRVCIVLKYWIETRIFDFDEQLLSCLNKFLANSVQPASSEMATRLMKTLETNMEKFSRILGTNQLPRLSEKTVETYVEKMVTQSSLLRKFPARVIAEQMSLKDCQMFRDAEIVGFLSQSWNKPKLQHRALALINFIERLDKYSFWVATLVLLERRKADRVEVVKKILEIAGELLDVHNNFHAVAGIVVGLNTAAVSRLSHTFNALPKKYKQLLERLTAFMNPHGSYSTYRNVLHSKTLPVVPFIGVYLSDLTFIDEGNPDVLEERYINFDKYDMTYNALREVLVFQQSRYEFVPNFLLQNYFYALPALDEKTLYNISLFVEPRGADPSEIL